VDGYYKVSKLKKDIPFLPEILQKEGYFTSRGLINDDILSTRGFNIRKAYDEYKEEQAMLLDGDWDKGILKYLIILGLSVRGVFL
jgi:hypothetical protein